MTLPGYISARLDVPTLKGRILDAPGADGGIWIFDPQGKVLAKGFRLRIVDFKITQLNPAAAPVENAVIEVTKATASGERQTYKITQPLKRVFEQFNEVIQEGVGEGVEWDTKDRFDTLLLVTMATSIKGKEELVPIHNTPQWTESSGWFYNGELVCCAPIEISREMTDPETGATLYRLRIPRFNGTGYYYTTVSWDDLHAGRYFFSDRLINVRNATKTAIGMLQRWESLTEKQRIDQEHEERTQPERDAQAERERQFRMAAPLYSAPHYRTKRF
jgi:hypothetical protein